MIVETVLSRAIYFLKKKKIIKMQPSLCRDKVG